jgi:hypothetical protein
MKKKSILYRIRRWWKLRRPVCPECNSDAPETYTCRVCNSYRTQTSGMPDKQLRDWWMAKHEAPKCEHGIPIIPGVRCHQCEEWLHRHVTAKERYGPPRRA